MISTFPGEKAETKVSFKVIVNYGAELEIMEYTFFKWELFSLSFQKFLLMFKDSPSSEHKSLSGELEIRRVNALSDRGKIITEMKACYIPETAS